LMRLLDRARPVSDVEHERWFAALPDKSDCAYFAIETIEDARHIGNIWLWNIDARHRRAELRILIGSPGDHGRGAGTEAIRLLCEYAFERLNLHKVYAYVLGINERARRAFERAGFTLEGTLREDRWVGDAYTDVYLLGKLR
jgi:RimJ/RimL family protein N-acetyltransferase